VSIGTPFILILLLLTRVGVVLLCALGAAAEHADQVLASVPEDKCCTCR
jgi:hypothetical protein